MSSIKAKFRPSTPEGKTETIRYEIIRTCAVRHLKTDYRLHTHEWDTAVSAPIIRYDDRSGGPRSTKENIGRETERLETISKRPDETGAEYTPHDIRPNPYDRKGESSLCDFMGGVIADLKRTGRHRTADTYGAALKSFMKFRGNEDLHIGRLDSDMIRTYETYLHRRGITKNSSSFYMRILRAVYNRAVEQGLAARCDPFRSVYTGIDKTVKRAVPIRTIKRIKNMDLSAAPASGFARDMFMFSFYTRGMSFVDMAYLKKTDLKGGVLTYRRRKTGQQMRIKWEKCMQEIIDRYDTGDSLYLLPIIRKSDMNERIQYLNALCMVNRKLKTIGKMIDLQLPLTTYVARHSWASAARNKNVPLSVISEGMGHDSETTTMIYLSSIDAAIVDRANCLIIDSL